MKKLLDIQFLHRGRLVHNESVPGDVWTFSGSPTHVADDPDVDRCMELTGTESAYLNTMDTHYNAVEGYWAANIKTASAAKQAIVSWTRTTGEYSELMTAVAGNNTLLIGSSTSGTACSIDNVTVTEAS